MLNWQNCKMNKPNITLLLLKAVDVFWIINANIAKEKIENLDELVNKDHLEASGAIWFDFVLLPKFLIDLCKYSLLFWIAVIGETKISSD